MESVPAAESGYCEVQDRQSGELFRVMRRHCNSIKNGGLFRCSDAEDFANFPLLAHEAVEKTRVSGFALPNVGRSVGRDGIVMVIYPKLLASAYASIRTLREVLSCHLPIELWFRQKEMNKVPRSLETLQHLADSDAFGGISLQELQDPLAIGVNAKIHAIYNSFFDRVLFLDADNVPVRDPSFLFESPEFVETGAVFWPDFWHPTRTIFNIQPKSLLWELLDLPFVDMFEQESGQLLIDRRRHASALELTAFYAFHRPSHLNREKLVYGDKDLFRLAWLKLKGAFHMIQTPPAVAGKVINHKFCGMTMVQHDAQGHVFFLHRNSHKLMGAPWRSDPRAVAVKREREKLLLRKEVEDAGGTIGSQELDRLVVSPSFTEEVESGGYPDAIVWTHLLSLRNTSSRGDYWLVSASQRTPKAEAGNRRKRSFPGRTRSRNQRSFIDRQVEQLARTLWASSCHSTFSARRHPTTPHPGKWSQ